MSLLTPINQTPPTPTKEIKLKRSVSRIKELSVNSYKTISEIQKQGISLLWEHPELTPQEIIDELGENAVKVFQYHGALTEYLVTLATLEGINPDIKLPPNAFTVNQDGTITVSEDPYVP
jgi:hypothetical protein